MKAVDTAQPLISIITPTHNSAKFIGETIESVINQTYRNWEMLIVDDDSTDNTVEIFKSYEEKDSRIKGFELGYHSGRPAVPRNYGIRNSRGKYVAFLDSDDMWHHCKLEKQLPYFSDKEIVGVSTDAIGITDTPFSYQGHRGRSKKGYVDYNYYSILNGNPISTSSVIVRKDVLSIVGGFDENPDFRFIEDWELWLRMARLGKFRILGERLLSYRVFSDTTRDRVNVAKRKLRILKKQLDLGYIKQKDIREFEAMVGLSVAGTLLHSGDSTCRGYYLAAFKDSTIFRRRLKACMGYLLSLQPRVFQKMSLLAFYGIHRILDYGGDLIWRIETQDTNEFRQ